MKRISIYCGSNFGDDPAYKAGAEDLAKILVREGLGIVYGGAAVGLMGTVADKALEAGGEVIGVIPGTIAEKVAHKNLTELHVVKTMHERKQLMFDLADGFIALPGGLGTMDEMFELLTWGQLGFHQKPCGFLNIKGYYDHLFSFLDHAVSAHFIKPENREDILSADNPEELIRLFRDQPRRVTIIGTSAHVVLALSARAGQVFPLDSRSRTIIPRRFFLGGASTLRGFGEEQLVQADVRPKLEAEARQCATSPTGTGCTERGRRIADGSLPVSEGGEAFVLGKAELRLPVTGRFELGLFVDAGNLWLDPNNVNLRLLRPCAPLKRSGSGCLPGWDARRPECLSKL